MYDTSDTPKYICLVMQALDCKRSALVSRREGVGIAIARQRAGICIFLELLLPFGNAGLNVLFRLRNES